MARICARCNRPAERNVAGRHVCDTVKLADGRVVHAPRVGPGGDLEGARIEQRTITEEMRAQMRKGKL